MTLHSSTSAPVDAIPWFGPEVGDLELRRLAEVIGSGYINDGQITREFEAKVAEFVGVKYCVGVSSGTAAITLALMGLGVGRGDEVIVPDITFIATANAVRLTGATVKLVDIEPRRFTLDVHKAASAIGPRTKAIVPVDVNGRGADYERLESLCRSKGLVLVADAAEALGSKWRGRYLGTFGDAGCFSFSANKTLTTGQGGMVATNNLDLYHRLRELKDQGRRDTGTGGDDLHPVMGFNFKLTNLQAAVGLAQFERLPARLQHARERDAWYRDLLSDCEAVVAIPRDEGEVLQWTDALCENRGLVEAALVSKQIGYRNFWLPLHSQTPYREDDENFKESIDVSRRGLWLPSSFKLTFEEAVYVAKTIRSSVV